MAEQVDLLWVRHQLDSMVMARTHGGLGLVDGRVYRELCALESTMIRQAGEAPKLWGDPGAPAGAPPTGHRARPPF